MKESPEFIKTTLTDVKKASHMINQHIDAMQLKIDQEQSQEAEQKQEKAPTMYYASVAYLQTTDATDRLDKFKMTATTMYSLLRLRNTTKVMLLTSPKSISLQLNTVAMTSLLRMSIMLWYIIRLLEAHTM